MSLGWRAIGDLRTIGPDRAALKAALAEAYPEARPRALPVWAGVLLRFAFEMAVGDLVVHPVKADSTLAIGRVAGGYAWRPDAPATSRHRRAVEWIEDGVPREAFSESARHELGSAITLFRVRRNAHEFAGFLERVVA